MKDTLRSYGLITDNYNGKKVLIIGGIIYLIINFFTIFFFKLYFGTENIWEKYYFLLIISNGIGIVDDISGNKKIKGFRGHLKSLSKGKLTTGLLKALIIFFAALLVNFNYPFLEMVLNTALIIFMSNFINLVDLRPGRAFKIYFILFIPAIFYLQWQVIFIIQTIIFLLMASGELNEKIMLGDGGANSLGASLGFFYSINFGNYFKLLLLFIIMIFNFLAEFYSFTEIIKKNKILNYIDQLGRKKL